MKKSKKPHFKNIEFKVEDVDDSGVVEGYAAAFDNVDLVDDIIQKGAFKKTIQETGGVWPILKDHNPSQKIGFNLEAKEDSRGLFIKEQLALDTQMGHDVFALSKLALEVGGKDGMSIGYFPIKAEPDRDKPHVRILKELKLLEHSHVTFPANEEAFSVAAKSWIESNEKDMGLGHYTDLFFKHMEVIGYSHRDVIEALQNYEAALGSENYKHLCDSIDRAIKVLEPAS